jgi:hypothetical protein
MWGVCLFDRRRRLGEEIDKVRNSWYLRLRLE